MTNSYAAQTISNLDQLGDQTNNYVATDPGPREFADPA